MHVSSSPYDMHVSSSPYDKEMQMLQLDGRKVVCVKDFVRV